MARCEICGTDFADRGFQVLVAGHARAYDRIECAERGRVLAGAGVAAFAHPFQARTIVVDAPRPELAVAAAPVGVAGSLLERASLARAKLAFGGTWLLAAGLAAASLYLSTRPDEAERSAAGPGSAAAPPRLEREASAPFVHEVDLLPGRRVEASVGEKKMLRKDRAGDGPAVLVREETASGPSAAAPAPQPQPTGAPSAPEPASPPPPPPVIQPVEPPPAAAPAPPPPPVAVAPPDAPSKPPKPGWGHGDKKHDHTGPPGKSK